MARIARVHPLARCLALSKQWLEPRYYAYEPVQGFRVHLFHEEPDHTFDVFALASLPGQGAPPHNHATWGVGARVDGHEKNVLWQRLEYGGQKGYTHRTFFLCAFPRFSPRRTGAIAPNTLGMWSEAR